MKSYQRADCRARNILFSALFSGLLGGACRRLLGEIYAVRRQPVGRNGNVVRVPATGGGPEPAKPYMSEASFSKRAGLAVQDLAAESLGLTGNASLWLTAPSLNARHRLRLWRRDDPRRRRLHESIRRSPIWSLQVAYVPRGPPRALGRPLHLDRSAPMISSRSSTWTGRVASPRSQAAGAAAQNGGRTRRPRSPPRARKSSWFCSMCPTFGVTPGITALGAGDLCGSHRHGVPRFLRHRAVLQDLAPVSTWPLGLTVYGSGHLLSHSTQAF